MSILATLSHFMGFHDPRSPAEIDSDVVEELGFHVEMRARDPVAAGLSPEEARRAAEERFGDFESIRRQCRAVHLEERSVLLRIQTVLIVCLVIVIAAMAWGMHRSERRSRNEVEALRAELAQVSESRRQRDPVGSISNDESLSADLGLAMEEARHALPSREAPEQVEGACPDSDLDAQDWIGLFALRPNDWRHGSSLAERIAKLPPEDGARIMAEVWPALTPEVKRQAIKPFVFDGGHPRALAVLHLAVTDPDLETQGRAFQYLRAYAFQDFSKDWESYRAWSAARIDLPLARVLTGSVRGFVGRLRGLEGEALSRGASCTSSRPRGCEPRRRRSRRRASSPCARRSSSGCRRSIS